MPFRDPAKKQTHDYRLRQRHAERIANGLCTRCGKLPPEPDRRMCACCGEKRRAADRARRARVRAQGKPYGGRDPDLCRRADRASDKRRRRARQEAGLCTSCGRRQPSYGGSVCDPCRVARRELDRRRYTTRRAAGLCVRCTQPAVGGLSRCGRCLALEAERISPERKSASGKKRYARRRARRLCVDCGVGTEGSARCPRCAYRSNTRTPERHLVPVWPPQYSVIEIANGADHGTYETEAEVAACLVFAGLRHDEVEIRSNAPLLALSPS
ncbi:MAG: hypothetical protein OXM01_17875 [Gemmatimonadota bacterium]|nr:hypothetical protein [Gemmatimonadota bacterium]